MRNNFNKGIILTSLGSFWWGFIGVIYFESVSFIGHAELVVHRCLWTAVMLIITTTFLSKWKIFYKEIKHKKKLIALPITQISTENDFFDFDAKYNGNSSEETPAPVSADLTSEIQETSKEIYDALQLGSVARIDYIVVNGRPFVIEVNTIPGFSKASIVPQMLKCAGIDLKDFWKMILEAELNN